MRKEANKCYYQNTKKLAEKRDEPYSVMMSGIRKKISFLMMKSIITCILFVEVDRLGMSEKNIMSRN